MFEKEIERVVETRRALRVAEGRLDYARTVQRSAMEANDNAEEALSRVIQGTIDEQTVGEGGERQG